MHILLIGSGGREHALAWKLAQSPRVERVSAAPGNVGMAAEPKVSCIDLGVHDTAGLLAWAVEHGVALCVVGPEVPLVAGIVDRFRAAGLRIVGPTAAAARLEGSKDFAKQFMQRHAIPTAGFATFSDVNAALAYLEEQSAPIVVKADGLAAGKGVVVAHSIEDARSAIRSMLADNRFGDAGAQVVIEEFLAGEEASFIALVDGKQSLALATSQDHKPRNDGDTGPNTGGMGACSPAPVVTSVVHERIVSTILDPVVTAMAAEGTPFTGFLYVGLMIDAEGHPRVVEFNVRLGDPETQPLMLRLDSDLVDLLVATVDGQLDSCEPRWSSQAALGVVLAAGEYPEGSSKGERIDGLEDAASLGCKVFHAGTRGGGDGTVETNGGRVLCVTATGDDLQAAKQLADQGAARIHWTGRHLRRDIGARALLAAALQE